MCIMNQNKDNPKTGAIFQERVLEWFVRERKVGFKSEKAINIGNPAHPHKFDIADENCNIVIECKCYSWTDAGNIPSAKLMGLNQAVFYFSFLSFDVEKILVMARAVHPKRRESLAEYYFRINKHLLGDVKIFEFDADSETMNIIKE